MISSEPKTKAEKPMKKVLPFIHLSIDSPMVIWFQEWEAFIGGGGGGGEGVGPGSGPEGTSGSPQPRIGGEVGGSPGKFDPVELYAAICDEFHPPETPGVTPDGRWISQFHARHDTAQIEALAHEHPTAYVALYLRGVFIGPIKVH